MARIKIKDLPKDMKISSVMYDMVFLHPPVSFRKREYPLSGLFEAGTGTTDLLTMMPLGMISMANELYSNGLETVVINIAKIFQEIRYKPSEKIEDYIRQFCSRIYGIDLHWAAHASGSFELARICKEQNPNSIVLLGGLTATRFADEILQSYPFIDGVVQGECDGFISDIVRALSQDSPKFHEAPNLVYRNNQEIRKNPILSPDLSKVDYIDSHSLVHPAPNKDRLEREAVKCHVNVVRGCTQECLFCGGSRSAYSNSFHRNKVEVVPVNKVLDQIRRSLDLKMADLGIKLFGDIRLGGKKYCQELLEGIKELPTPLDIYLELFWPASREFLESWKKAARDLYIGLSPESSHPELRKLHGKTYSNEDILEQARICKELGITGWFWFMYLLPGHTPENLMQEIAFAEEILKIDPSLSIMIQPYLFMDPASTIFEYPKEYGFSNKFSSVAKIQEALNRAYWYHTIGYNTSNFSELEYHRAILDVTRKTAQIYFKHNRLSARDLLRTYKNLECHGEMGKLIKENQQMSDEKLQESIETIFPEYLRHSNSNLLIKHFFQESFGQFSSPEAMIYDAFPTVLELLLRYNPQAEDIHMRIDQWIKSHNKELSDWYNDSSPAAPIKDLILELLKPLKLPLDFNNNLAEFEWDVYKLLYFTKPQLIGEGWKERYIIKVYNYDMICIDELLTSVVYSHTSPHHKNTFYLFDLKTRDVITINQDPRIIDHSVPNTLIRKMSILGRLMICMEHRAKTVFSRIQKRSDPHNPEVLYDGRALSVKEIEELIFNH